MAIGIEDRFAMIADTVDEAFFITDAAIGHLEYVSPGYERIWGRSCESLYASPQSFQDAIHPDDAAHVAAHVARQHAGLPVDCEYRIVRPDGEVRWVWTRGREVVDAEGKKHYVGSARDVSARRRAEQEARALAERFALMTRATSDGVWDWNIVTGEAWWSETLFDTFGFDRATTVPSYEAWAERVHPEDRPGVLVSFETTLAEHRSSWRCEFRYRHGDGRWREVEDRAYVIFDPAGKPIRMVGAMMDLTPRRELEHQLRQAQKTEIIGQLAGGVAHDFNNLLQAILIQAAMLEAIPALPAAALAVTRDLRACADRAAAVVRQLQVLGRREVMQPREIDVNTQVAQLSTMLERVLAGQLVFAVELAAEPLWVRADPGMLDQVVLNLALNARDAMPDGGTLEITTRRIERGEQVLACIGVRDTGTGIAPDVLPRIFDAFFTTKQPGHGTGLGLASAHGIVERHGGTIEVETAVGAGTTFRVLLPVTAPRRRAEQLVSARDRHVR